MSLPTRVATTAAVLGLLACAFLAPAQQDAETRVLLYIREHLRPGQPLLVTDLYNNVFTQPDERQALSKLYNAFFRIPLFVAQYQEKFGSPPTLKIISEQFALRAPDGADVLLRVMESDPRVPRFLTRNPQTGEITQVDIAKIRNDPRFGQALERQLAGWDGKLAPELALETLGGAALRWGQLRGKPVLIYVWFTGCPPCMKETPDLVTLYREFSGRGFAVVGANADRFLGLSVDDQTRLNYIRERHIEFPVVSWTRDADKLYGGISIFPALFLVDRRGTISHHWVGYVPLAELRAGVEALLDGR
jgi:thiol-disulfide isomerase/thioredoxin